MKTRSEYLEQALDTWNPDKIMDCGASPERYLKAGLISELGELIGLHKRDMRDGVQPSEAWIKELGDCLWYACVFDHTDKRKVELNYANCLPMMANEVVANGGDFTDLILEVMKDCIRMKTVALASLIEGLIIYLKFDVSETRATNIAKLADRKARGVIGGKGDDR